MSEHPTRRDVLSTVGAATATATFAEATTGTVAAATGASESSASTVAIPHGVQTGDVKGDRAMLWSRADRPARMYVELATDADFSDVRTVRGPAALAATDYTAKVDLRGLPRGAEIYYRVRFEDLAQPGAFSDPVPGSFRTPPEDGAAGDVRFLWSGDVAGQGWGIDRDRGGMTIFEPMRDLEPDFFVHSGDAVYADGPLPEEVELADGTVWDNVVTDAKSEVADELAEFRGNYKYNLRDEHYRNFFAEVPTIPLWDDHEVTNNWYPGETLPADDPHDVKSANLLAARGQRAFVEFVPIRSRQKAWDEHYESFRYGSALEVFRLDCRSYRGPNTATRAEERSEETAVLGEEQLAWLKESLVNSDATWKAIASDLPIGLIVTDGDGFEGIANVDGEPRGREHEVADLLSTLRSAGARNVVWFTADVHYTAAHHYHPKRAQFTDFAPFWEFVSGPLHAGTFGPNDLDDTFGPKVAYQKAPPSGESNLPPSEGLQFFGQVDVAGDSGRLTVTLRDREGTALYRKTLDPDRYGRRGGRDDPDGGRDDGHGDPWNGEDPEEGEGPDGDPWGDGPWDDERGGRDGKPWNDPGDGDGPGRGRGARPEGPWNRHRR